MTGFEDLSSVLTAFAIMPTVLSIIVSLIIALVQTDERKKKGDAIYEGEMTSLFTD